MSEPEMTPSETPAPTPATAAPEPAAVAPAASAPSQPYQAPPRASKLGHMFFIGVFLTLMGVFWRLVEAEEAAGWVTSAWIFAAIVIMLVPIAWHLPDIFRSAASRRGTAFVMVLATIGLGLFVALFVGWADITLKKKGKLPEIDLTSSSRFTLDDESMKLLDKVEGTVYATYLHHATEDEGLRTDAIAQLRVFEAASPHVKFAEVDAVRQPDIAARILKEQGVQGTSSGEDTDLIVLTYAEPGKEVAPGKQKEIKVERWAFTKMSSAGVPKWLGESVVSTGIYELVFQKYKAYATGGHGERSFADDFRDLRDALTRQNIDAVTTPINLATTPKVPDDCELLFILGPTAPFTPEEAEAVTRWLDQGRTLIFTVDMMDDRSPTGLEALLEKYGVGTRTNYEVIAPKVGRDMARGLELVGGMSNQFPVYGDAYGDHPAVRALRSRSGLATYFFRSTYLEVDDKPPADATPEVVCSAPEHEGTGSTPVALRHTKDRTNFSTIMPDRDKVSGKFPLIVTSVRKPKDAAGRDSRIVVSGDTDVFSDRLIGSYPANLDLVRGLVQWGLRREGLVAVSERSLEDPYVTPDEYQKRFALYWPLAVVFLPLIVGGMVWWSRRR